MCSHDNVTIYYRYKTRKQNFIKYEIIIKRRIEEAKKFQTP